jgi:hypothetical protein
MDQQGIVTTSKGEFNKDEGSDENIRRKFKHFLRFDLVLFF